MVHGMKGPGYLERKFQGMNGPGTNVPGTKVPSWEWMFQGMNSLENEYS